MIFVPCWVRKRHFLPFSRTSSCDSSRADTVARAGVIDLAWNGPGSCTARQLLEKAPHTSSARRSRWLLGGQTRRAEALQARGERASGHSSPSILLRLGSSGSLGLTRALSPVCSCQYAVKIITMSTTPHKRAEAAAEVRCFRYHQEKQPSPHRTAWAVPHARCASSRQLIRSDQPCVPPRSAWRGHRNPVEEKTATIVAGARSRRRRC